MAAAAAPAVGLESPAVIGGPACPAEARFQFGSIDDYEMVEEIGEGTFGALAELDLEFQTNEEPLFCYSNEQ